MTLLFGSRRRSDAAGVHGTPAYWDDIESRHRDHRAMARNLTIVAAAVVVLALIVSINFLALLALLLPLLLIQLGMMRVTRPR